MPLDRKSVEAPRERGIFCNRTLNLRAIRAIGYDMDYTLIHYHAKAWERRAYDHLKRILASRGLPVEECQFDPDFTIRGLVIDSERGNLVKANRFGYVKRAYHGTRLLDHTAQRDAYARTMIDLGEPRWSFLNTFFSLSEACMYGQLVDLLDAGRLPGTLGYEALYRLVKTCLDAAHMEGQLKAEIVSNPEKFVVLDPETALALLDQKRAGKKLMLVTNSDFPYTEAMMSYAFDRFLPAKTTWRSLFDVIIVAARKPDFFLSKQPLFKIVSEKGLLEPTIRGLEDGGVYFGGSASLIEEHLGLSGDEILYVGDHIYGDVKVSKNVLRWRTCLILRELEDEIQAITETSEDDRKLAELMEQKESLERAQCEIKLELLRRRDESAAAGPSKAELEAELVGIRAELMTLDEVIAPFAKAQSELSNSRWGLLLRAGNDKSHLARQLERSADIYTSRVSNFLFATPFVYLRSPRGSMPHDPQPGAVKAGGSEQRPA